MSFKEWYELNKENFENTPKETIAVFAWEAGQRELLKELSKTKIPQ